MPPNFLAGIADQAARQKADRDLQMYTQESQRIHHGIEDSVARQELVGKTMAADATVRANVLKDEVAFQAQADDMVRQSEAQVQPGSTVTPEDAAWMMRSDPRFPEHRATVSQVLTALSRGAGTGASRPGASPAQRVVVPAGPPPSGTVYMLTQGTVPWVLPNMAEQSDHRGTPWPQIRTQ